MLARTLTRITGVPEHILKEGFLGNRPCVAQIMSWAARRTTTRVEDRAYSLMGLLDVNMPMLYGEGKKASYRLQLEIIRSSNDQSIFAWGHDSLHVRCGSVLADDPRFFEHCSEVELMDHEEFIECLKRDIPIEQSASIDQDCFGTFPITNRGIHIWMFLRHYHDSDSVFRAYLPCLKDGCKEPLTIDLTLWTSNYYRHSSVDGSPKGDSLQLRRIYLRYQDMPCNVSFEIDDSAITENGFACCNTYPSKLTESTLTLTDANPLCVKTYSERQGNSRFAVAFGQCFGLDWVHLINDLPSRLSWGKLLVKGPEYARSMADTPSRGDCRGRLWVHHLPVSSWIVRTHRVVWERSTIGVRIELFRDPGFHYGLEWKMFNIDVSDLLYCMLFTEHHYDYSEGR